jgi:predicted DNA-binding protein (MmcQ/YjbR family)
MMEWKQIRQHCLGKANAWEDYPFGPDPLVFKVGKKMFALVSLDAKPLRLSLKCDPEDAQVLRRQYASITPGYHLNKTHWNTLVLDDSLPPDLVYELIDHSYDLVAGKKTKK